MTAIYLEDRFIGAVYGALIGDAVGTSYEFKKPEDLPPKEQIEMIPPEGYKKSWSAYPWGIWSDDGSQMLNLLEYYSEKQPDDNWSQKWADKLLQWDDGHLWWNNTSFDSGIQTMEAIRNIRRGVDPMLAAPLHERRNGNGSLMRCLPTALWYYKKLTNVEMIIESMNISHLTHPHNYSKYTCAAYNLVAVNLLLGIGLNDAVESAFYIMAARASEGLIDRGDLSVVYNYAGPYKGSGYVLDCFWTAIEAVSQANNYEEAIKNAIAYGHDTDTTAIVAGGLAGIVYGMSGIPMRWVEQLKGKEMVEPLIKKLLDHQWNSTP